MMWFRRFVFSIVWSLYQMVSDVENVFIFVFVDFLFVFEVD